jgi:hypothetical protein
MRYIQLAEFQKSAEACIGVSISSVKMTWYFACSKLPIKTAYVPAIPLLCKPKKTCTATPDVKEYSRWHLLQ